MVKINCPECNIELTHLVRGASWSEILLVLITAGLAGVFLFLVGGAVVLVLWALWYVIRKPDRCPMCGTSLKIEVIED